MLPVMRCHGACGWLAVLALCSVSLLSCKRPNKKTPEQAAQAFLRAYQAADAAELERLVDPGLARIDARTEACRAQKVAALTCELEHLDISSLGGKKGEGVLEPSSPDPKPECDEKALRKTAEACPCRAPTPATSFVDTATYRLLKKTGLQQSGCRVKSTRALSLAELKSELPDWGHACDDLKVDAAHALVVIECSSKPEPKPITLVLQDSETGWKIFTLASSTRTAHSQ